MLSEASSKNFTSKVKSLTAYNGGTSGIYPDPGPHVRCRGAQAGRRERGEPAAQDWYVQLQKEQIGVAGLGEMMAGRATPAETIKKIQGFADAAAKDTSIKHYKHQ